MKSMSRLVGLLFVMFSLNGFASDADLAKEAKKYKTLEALCKKSKEWSTMGIAIYWSSNNKCVMPSIPPLMDARERYSSLAPYVFANMQPGNVFFKLDGFTYNIDNSIEDGKYKILLSRSDMKVYELNKLLDDFNKKYTKIDFQTEKENRSVEYIKSNAYNWYKMGLFGKETYEREIREATPTVATWDTTVFSNNKDEIIFKVTTIAPVGQQTSISVDVTYTAK